MEPRIRGNCRNILITLIAMEPGWYRSGPSKATGALRRFSFLDGENDQSLPPADQLLTEAGKQTLS